jgi:sigma-B regulation protein RsbU (phosphoserine phosphatase)
MVAGLACGPWVGLGVELIGAAFRATEPGVATPACSLNARLAGIFGGLVYLKMRKFPEVSLSVAFAIFYVAFHMTTTAMTVTLAEHIDLAVDVVKASVLPMILSNATGMLIFACLISNHVKEKEAQEQRDHYQRELDKKKAEIAVAVEIQKSFYVGG